MSALAIQHLIDPAICIRCNTCEESCPVGAIEHDSRNYVVKLDVCNGCKACVAPCPTGAIDNWRTVASAKPYTLPEQFGWDDLPAATQASELTAGSSEVPEEVVHLTAAASSGQGAGARAPKSATRPAVNLYSVEAPIVATVSGNYRLTGETVADDIRHMVLDFGTAPFPVLEGQSIGIVPPGDDSPGRRHHVRLYSVASPRDGERPGYNNLALTVKRVVEDHQGRPIRGVCSNYVCDLRKGDKVQVVGPYGTTFLMPNEPGASLLMICTGTGSAPMRAMTERRRRRIALKDGGKNILFFGAKSPEQLPYFGPLKKLPEDFIDINLALSRVPGTPKKYVQDLIREREETVARLLKEHNSYIYICGLKGMEMGVEQAFQQVCDSVGLDWNEMRRSMIEDGRFHIETY